MTYDEIKSKLHDRIDRDRGDTFTCTCPAHDDNRASLSVSRGDDGRTCIHCHAGCDTEAVLKSVGLNMNDLFADNGRMNGRMNGYHGDPIVATYDYRGADGAIVFQVVRKQSKSFLQRHPDGAGGWIYKMDGVDRVLYQLPAILSSKPDEWVFIPEGEKDCDNLRKHDYVATTNAGGANAKWLPSYTKTLRNRRVCILPDNDEPGRIHGLTVAKALVGVAADVRILELPGLPDKGDVTDWLNAGNDPADLVALAENTPKFGQAGAAPADAANDKSGEWIKHLREMGHEFALNVLEDNVECNGQRLDDVTRSKIYLGMVNHSVPKSYVDDVINVVAAENAYHPVKRYLLGLNWDGGDHLTTLLRHISGDDIAVDVAPGIQQPLYSLLITRWLIGCVARALDGDNPGAFKHQTPMLVFVGAQGIGKSAFCRWLCEGIGVEFHREGPMSTTSIDDQRSMVTKWIWEVSELGASLRRSDREAVKSFITQEWFTYRKPWGKSSITKPTLCNLVGSINPTTGFLDDPTGHRRFLPISVSAIDKNYEKLVDVNQLWAQLVHLYHSGVSPELSDSERRALAEIHKDHESENPLQTYLQMYFDVDPSNENYRCFTAEILSRLQQFKVSVAANPRVAGREINDALAPMGLTRKKLSINGVKGWGWVGINPNLRNPDPR